MPSQFFILNKTNLLCVFIHLSIGLGSCLSNNLEFAEDMCLSCDLIVYHSFRISVTNVISFVPLLLPVLSIKIAVVGSILLSCM